MYNIHTNTSRLYVFIEIQRTMHSTLGPRIVDNVWQRTITANRFNVTGQSQTSWPAAHSLWNTQIHINHISLTYVSKPDFFFYKFYLVMLQIPTIKRKQPCLYCLVATQMKPRPNIDLGFRKQLNGGCAFGTFEMIFQFKGTCIHCVVSTQLTENKPRGSWQLFCRKRTEKYRRQEESKSRRTTFYANAKNCWRKLLSKDTGISEKIKVSQPQLANTNKETSSSAHKGVMAHCQQLKTDLRDSW